MPFRLSRRTHITSTHLPCQAGLSWRPASVCRRKISIAHYRTSRTTHLTRQAEHVVATCSSTARGSEYSRPASFASRSALNSPSHIPDVYASLHNSLTDLFEAAYSYVNLSRLQLALQTIQHDKATLRIGVLGLGNEGEKKARQLVRTLLADALGSKAEWEDHLLATDSESRSVLLRYGAEYETAPSGRLLKTLVIPSRFLQQHNVEILIGGLWTARLEASLASPHDVVESILTPLLETPISASGRSGLVRFPLHRALLVGRGLTGALDMSHALGAIRQHKELITAVLDISGTIESSDQVLAVNVDQAATALSTFREDVANGPLFNQMWQASGIEAAARWIGGLERAPKGDASAARRHLIKSYTMSLLTDAERSIETAASEAQQLVSDRTIHENRRKSFQAAISEWSDYAHTDLEQSLARAALSSSWRRTSWARLLWAVDDVGIAADDVLRCHWLVDAEARLAYLAGSIQTAGFVHDGTDAFNEIRHSNETKTAAGKSPPDASLHTGNNVKPGSGPERLWSQDTQDKALATVDQQLVHSHPWPMAIHFARQHLLQSSVPRLQSRAQILLAQVVTSIGGTSALGGWVYVATGSADVYQAGAIAALGLVWGLRRLQKHWTLARCAFLEHVRDAGRVVLRDVESTLRRIVSDNGRPRLDDDQVERWQTARRALERCRAEVDTLYTKR